MNSSSGNSGPVSELDRGSLAIVLTLLMYSHALRNCLMPDPAGPGIIKHPQTLPGENRCVFPEVNLDILMWVVVNHFEQMKLYTHKSHCMQYSGHSLKGHSPNNTSLIRTELFGSTIYTMNGFNPPSHQKTSLW